MMKLSCGTKNIHVHVNAVLNFAEICTLLCAKSKANVNNLKFDILLMWIKMLPAQSVWYSHVYRPHSCIGSILSFDHILVEQGNLLLLQKG